MTSRDALDRRPARQRILVLVRAVLVVLCLVAAFVVAMPGSARAEEVRWMWPTPAPHDVVTPFDAPDTPYGPGHRGIDIAVTGEGAAVHAVDSGTVRFTGSVAGRPVVSVRHADGLISTYEPVAGEVVEGQTVRAGDVLGRITPGSTQSHCAQMCLHLGARRAQGYVDPMVLLGARGPSVLLPLAHHGAPGARDAVDAGP
ncbi:murein hydrolase activator EnvC family protein [Brachybacterium sp. GCM10030252]|uniref:murein hydrolase activator EnvC family protein n=1 Tax=Brachybacterium sp. GCM10030252 TaxID=3273380 RepID=UPI003608A6B9